MFLDRAEFHISIRLKFVIQYLADCNEMEKWIYPILFMFRHVLKVTTFNKLCALSTDFFIQNNFSVVL